MLTSLALPVSRLRLPKLPDTKQWLSSLVLVTMAGLYMVAGLSVTALEPGRGVAGTRTADGRPVIPGLGVPPKPEPLRFREVPPQDALAINAAVPVSDLPNPAARAFAAAYAGAPDRLRALECLTAAVYYEAAVESTDGQRAVAQVVLNRARHPAYPASVCGVVFQGSARSTGCQFTFTCDGSLARTPSAAGWARAKRVAADALAGHVYKPVGWATHYHTNWVVPYWSSSLVKLANVGTHIFYRWEGGWGKPGAFRRAGAGAEPQVALMRRLTSDPSSLAGAVDLVDEAAAAAAENADSTVQPSIDSFQRAVLRRYEPMTREAATAAAAARSDKPLTASTHWALSGLPQKPATPLGQRAAAAPAPAAAPAQPPRCLEGVRRLPAKPDAPAEKQTC
jgi:Cell Wall Hydrolase